MTNDVLTGAIELVDGLKPGEELNLSNYSLEIITQLKRYVYLNKKGSGLAFRNRDKWPYLVYNEIAQLKKSGVFRMLGEMTDAVLILDKKEIKEHTLRVYLSQYNLKNNTDFTAKVVGDKYRVSPAIAKTLPGELMSAAVAANKTSISSEDFNKVKTDLQRFLNSLKTRIVDIGI